MPAAIPTPIPALGTLLQSVNRQGVGLSDGGAWVTWLAQSAVAAASVPIGTLDRDGIGAGHRVPVGSGCSRDDLIQRRSSYIALFLSTKLFS